jgi:23S rRNA (adenine2503-C2)-methyltransferase
METLTGLTTAELTQTMLSLGEPAYRGKQLARWIYQRLAADWEEMTDLPKSLRARLAEQFALRSARICGQETASDGTVKYLLQLSDGEQIESVYLPYEDRVSVCLSTQAGCPAGCAFCATALGGLARSLTAGEIVEQVILLQRKHPQRRISHAVYMGMGEPLLNYANVIKSVQLFSEEMGMSARQLTISTVGVAPGIRQLAQERLPVTLALSLHAPEDQLRQKLIPTARKWSLEEILDACREYYAKTKRNLTFEYLLLADVNDHPDQARALAKRLVGIPGNVNLIPFNYVETPEGFRRPSAKRIRAFRSALEEAGRVTTQRMERGHAISAACGQLRRAAGQRRPQANGPAVNS